MTPDQPEDVRVAVVGAGAFGSQHVEALDKVAQAQVAWIVDDDLERARALADSTPTARASDSLTTVLAQADVDAVILATPSPMHAAQACETLEAGKHVLVEIPVALSAEEFVAVTSAQRNGAGIICMPGHVRRFNPPHRWLGERIRAGDLALHHLVVETYFMRRSNLNARGEPRTWTDNLLWHHARHSVDLFRWLVDEPIESMNAMQGPPSADLGIPLDLSLQLRSRSGRVCTLALSFNNDGPHGSWFRYICDDGTYVARYDDLVNGHGTPVDLGRFESGLVAQGREFVEAIAERRQPHVTLDDVAGTYEVLGHIARRLS